MRTLCLLLVPILAVSCSASRPISTYSTYQDWDSNHDLSIDRNEFVSVYEQSDYFDKWSSGGPVDYTDFFEGIFKILDGNSDSNISEEEFNTRIKQFYFSMSHDSFKNGDSNASGFLEKNEFMSQVKNSNLASLWDVSGDKRITEREMAGGMFYYCDTDNNGRIDEIEFNAWKINR